MSRQAAEHFEPPLVLASPVWEWLLEAVSVHDCGWMEEDAHPAIQEDGFPHDFKSVPASVHVPIWKRSLQRARERSAYLTLLVALHGRWLYMQFPDKQSAEDQKLSDDFLGELNRVIDTESERLSRGCEAERRASHPESLEMARRLLGFFDGLSLVALDALPLPEQTEELGFGAHKAQLEILRDGERALTVEPWPFSAAVIVMETPAIRLDRVRFENSSDLAQALHSGHRETIRREIRRAPR
jgi:hypothetical protein